MKIVLDLADLVERGQLTTAEAERLKGFAVAETSALGTNILLAFGATAISIGVAALFPSLLTAIVMGAVLFAGGLALKLVGGGRWLLFAQVCLTIGTLALSGGISVLAEGAVAANLGIALAVGAAAVVAQSGLLVSLAVIAFAATIGAATTYEGAIFWQPTLSIGLLAAMTLALYFGSLRLPAAYERIALIAARVAIMMLNFGFLIGSLLGDSPINLPPLAFSITWAVLLVVTGLWAIRANRRWVVNTAAVFGAIHFCIQWFLTLGPSPLVILCGGLLLIAFGFLIAAFNRRPLAVPAAQPAG